MLLKDWTDRIIQKPSGKKLTQSRIHIFFNRWRVKLRKLRKVITALLSQWAQLLPIKTELYQTAVKYQSIFENAVEGIFQTTPDGQYISANPALAKIYGYSSVAELLTKLTDIEHQLYVDPRARTQFVQTLYTHDVVLGFEAQVYRKDGSIIWICENARAVRDQRGNLLYYEGTVEDITERRQVKSLLAGQNAILEAIAKGYPLSEILYRLVRFIEEQSYASQGSIFLLDSEGSLRLGAAPSLPESYKQHVEGLKLGSDAGCCGTAAYLKRTVIVADISSDPLYENYRHLALAYGLKACWSMPIFSSTGEVLGTLAMYYPQPRKPSAFEQQLLTKATHLAGIAIERALTEEKLYHEAFYDSLTQLPNRAWLMNKLGQLVEQTQPTACSQQFAVLFLDLDNFKVINDSLGHLVGDRLLQQIARRLETAIASQGTVARLGGDEFTILLEKVTDSEAVRAIAAQIHHQLSFPFNLEEHEVFTNASIGIVLSHSPYIGYSRPEDLLRDADIAMYYAKAAGKGRYAVFDATMHERAVTRLELETELRRALKTNLTQPEFQLHYQPIVSLTHGGITGFEALARWCHPQRGWISPVEFIPIAEETGLIFPLGEWVLETACRQMVAWQQRYPQAQAFSMNVNLSSVQLVQPGLIDRIDQILQQTGLPGQCLKLEITESLIMETGAATLSLLEQLKKRQIHLCIDDFGTGYSSLSRLHELPIDTLKIDKSFVSQITDDNSHWKMLGTIVTLARNLGMEAIAEGIETQSQLDHLRQLKCQQGQGYFFSKPLAVDSAEALIWQCPRW